ncbi:Fpg/Nei family DNA glycosylase [Corynebacterium auriscanis]|uniref:Fpg/Nei family DNA glycosylase n=1 Tax=Corynebacterium auriscanis TaxID=99807 RepID=UPI003CE70C80
MPEGHVIHRLARHLNQNFGGQVMRVSSPQGRFAAEAALIDGTQLCQARAWGKHLFLEFSSQRIVHIHLGLIGSFRIEPYQSDTPWGQVRLHLHRAIDDGGADAYALSNTDRPAGSAKTQSTGTAGGAAILDNVAQSDNQAVAANLRGPQWCRLITEAEMDIEIGKLGADPLRPTDPLNLELKEGVFRRLMRSRRSISSLLMDQKFFAGVGNIYRAEVLFRLGINPETRGDVASERKEEIWEDLVELMAYGEQHGRIDTVRQEHSPEAMERAPREDDHGGEVYVYRRAGQPCLVCGDGVQHAVVEGRNLFWCPTCQR